MKKILTIILSFSILCSTWTFFSVSAETDIPFLNDDNTYDQTIVVDFEDGTFPSLVALRSSNFSVSTPGRGVGKGHLTVTPSAAGSSVFVAFGGKSGISYDVSFLSTHKTLLAAVHTTQDAVNTQTLSIETKELSDGWFKYTSSFTVPENTKGTCSFEIIPKDKSAFSVDEIVLSPKLDSSVIREGNLVKYSSFETEEEISKLLYNKRVITLSQGTAPNDLDQKSLHVQCNGKGWGNISQDVELRVGRKYRISFWAKAADDATNGLDINLAIDRNRRTDSAAPIYAQPYDKENPYITKKWVKYSFEYQCTTATTDTCTPSIYLRVGNKSTDVLDYYFDELIIEEIPDSYDIDSSAILTGDAFERSAINFTIHGYMNSVGAWYRLYAPYNNEHVIVKSGYLANGESVKYYVGDSATGNYKVEYNAIDAWGLAGSTKTAYLSKSNISSDEIIRANYNTSIWVDEMETLDATVQYQSGNVSKDVQAVLALYDDENRLLTLDSKTASALPEKRETIPLSAQNSTQATRSRILLWDSISMQPLREEKEFSKTIADHFVFVDPKNGVSTGTDAGSFQKPYKTINQGRNAVRRHANSAKSSGVETEIKLVLMPGVYDVTSSALTMTRNNTTIADNVHTSIVSYKPNEAVLSGGKSISGFTLHDEDKNIYRAKATDINSRQLYVNGVRAIRARSTGRLENCVNLGKDGVGVTTTDTSLMNFKRINELELVFFEHWTNPRFVVETATLDETTGLVALQLNETLWSGRMKGQNTVPTVPEYYENAYELLDEEGEFYLDKTAGYLYYIPRAHEDLSTAEVIMPVAESLLTVTGTADEPMKNISFEGIHFKYCTWNAPTEKGYADGQNNGGKTATTSGFIPSALTLTNIHNVDFYNCKISKIGQTGIKMLEAIQNCDFIGNEIYDISGGAMMIGDATWSNSRAPQEEKYYVTNVNVTDNYIHDISLEYRAGAAVTAAFPKNSNICHNEIFRTSYSAIHTGWGWDSKAESGTVNFKINNNYLHKVLFDKMYDGGAIYVLGHTGGSLDNLNEMCGNYCYDIANKFGVLYPDQGSSYWYLDRNVVDLTPHPMWYGRGDSPLEARWTHIHMKTIEHIVYGDHNYSTTSAHLNNGSNIQYKAPNLYANADWPQEALDIIDASGIRKEYIDNFDFGVQEVYFPQEFMVNAGETVQLAWVPTTTKMTKYDLGDAVLSFESLNPDIATIDANGNVNGVAPGTAKIRIKVYEKEVERIFEGSIVVP